MSVLPRKCDIIIFDFDGVLGMTMEDNYNAWKSAFETRNIVLERMEYFLLEGCNTREVARQFCAKAGIETSPDAIEAIVRHKEAHYASHASFSFYDGVESLIPELRRSYTLGLVTGAGCQRLERTAGAAFLSNFAVIVTGDKVTRGKPDPDPYLQAAREANVAAERCIVIENAPLGIEAAHRAGMFCIAVESTLPAEYLAGADMIVRTIVDVGPLLCEEG